MNPYKIRLERARAALEKTLAAQARFEANLIPSTYMTGNSGVPASRRRKLDKQLDRTIDLAVKLNKQRARVEILQRQFDYYESHPPQPKKPKPKPKPRSARARLTKEAMLMLSIDGEFTLPSGDKMTRMGVVIGDDIEGVTKVVFSDGREVWFKAKSIQGVHHMAMDKYILKDVLGV